MDINTFNIILNIIVGFFIGIAIGLTGIGGGVLIMPALIHIIKIPPITAVGTGLAFALLTKIGGLIEHIRLKTIRKRTGLYFIIGSAPAVIISSQFMNYYSRNIDPVKFNLFLQHGIFVILLISCITLILQTCLKKSNSYYIPETHFPLKRKIGGIISGIVIGIFIGTTSIGGGIFVIPVLIIIFNISTANTVGTSIMISVVLAALGGSIYLLNGNLIVSTVILMSIGSLVGVSIGSRIAVKLPDKILKSIVIGIVILAAFSMFIGFKR